MGTSEIAGDLKVPGVGARGGLGRTILTAFLVLAIVPLGFVSWYAIDRSRSNIQREVTEKLVSIAALKESQVARWVEGWATTLSRTDFTLQVDTILQENDAGSETMRADLAEMARHRGLDGLGLLDDTGRIEWANDSGWDVETLFLGTGQHLPEAVWVAQASLGTRHSAQVVLAVPLNDNDVWSYVVARIPMTGLMRIIGETAGLGQTGRVYLVDWTGQAFPQERQISSPAIESALSGQNGQGMYSSYDNVPVIGVYRWIPSLGLALFVEQAQEEAFAGNDAVAAAVVAIALGVALFTAIVAAVVTRQITSPVVRLTETALHIANGDLSQRLEVTSRDEIGILARVFNQMSAELQVLYNDLEEKVAQRTRLLQEANYTIQRRAIQMQASLEVGQAITSILNPDQLLEEVVGVVRDRFVYSYVVIYTVEEKEEGLLLRAAAGQPAPSYGDRVPLDFPGPIGQAFREGRAVVDSQPVSLSVGPAASYTHSEVALPLRLGDRTLGVLCVQTTEEEPFDEDEVSALRNLANQVTIALENARAYAVEREAVVRLQELDRSKRRFLANMSHELLTPLTNIIGFSRLMLKEIDGPLLERQATDLQIIYENGQHLLGLINDLLDVSQIEAGLMELEFRPVNLGDLIESVMATGSALVRDRPVTLWSDIQPDLPLVQADPTRIRQALLRLVANAAKFTEVGEIRVRAWADDARVYVSVRDTGMGIAPQDRERIFERFEQGTLRNGHRPNGAGLGLALSKEFIEMHGGEIKVESAVGVGSTFTFSLPIEHETAQEQGAGGAGNGRGV